MINCIDKKKNFPLITVNRQKPSNVTVNRQNRQTVTVNRQSYTPTETLVQDRHLTNIPYPAARPC